MPRAALRLRIAGNIPPIVTGAFGGIDTAASIILALAEHLAKANECEFYAEDPPFKMKAAFIVLGELLQGADRMTEGKYDLESHWNKWADRLMEAIHDLKEAGLLNDDPISNMIGRAASKSVAYVSCQISHVTSAFGAAVLGVLVDHIAEQTLGHELHLPDAGGLLHDIGNEIGHVQTVVAGPTNVPTHTQLAKDHDDHPLHDLAARMATATVGRVFDAYVAARSGTGTTQQLVDEAQRFLCHPYRIAPGSPQAGLLELTKTWAAATPDKVAKAADLKWVAHHAEHWREAKAKIRKIIGDLVGVDKVDQFIKLVEDAFKSMPQDGLSSPKPP